MRSAAVSSSSVVNGETPNAIGQDQVADTPQPTRGLEEERDSEVLHLAPARARHDQHAAVRDRGRERRARVASFRLVERAVDREVADNLYRAGVRAPLGELPGVRGVDGVDTLEERAIAPARELVGRRAAAQALVQARRVHQVAAQVEHQVIAVRYVRECAAERKPHVLARRKYAQPRERRARDVGFASRCVIVGDEEQRRVERGIGRIERV